MADAFRNYKKAQYTLSTEELMVDKAQLPYIHLKYLK